MKTNCSSVYIPHVARRQAAEGPADKLSIAVIGIGGQGEANLSAVAQQNIVALCDVDETRGAKGFAPYDWRFWWEFGTGETGNWGCHILGNTYWALDLGLPVRVAGSGPTPDPDRTPTALTSRLDYPERTAADGRTLPPVSVHWYQCDKRPPILDELGIDAPGPDGKRPSDGKNTLFIGSKGMLLCGFSGHVLLPADAFAGATVPQTIPPSPGFHAEWLAACRGGPPATCHFGYSGPMAESTLLANIAYRVQTEFAWDAASLTSGRADVDALLRREYRKGCHLFLFYFPALPAFARSAISRAERARP